MKLCVMLMSLVLPLVGQTVPIVDGSQSGSPIEINGTVTFDPNDPANTSCALTAHNQTNKTIIAYSMTVHVIRPDGSSVGTGTAHDHFFVDVPIALPATDFDLLRVDCLGFFGSRSNDIAYPKRPPEARITISFVQFDDGSVWGNETSIQARMFQRSETVTYLKSLQTAYSGGGESALSHALQVKVPIKDPLGRPRFMVAEEQMNLLRLDMKTAADQIDKELAMAKAHAAWLQ